MKKYIALSTITLCVAGCSGFSSEQVEQAKEQCKSFYETERMGMGKQVKVNDSWEKEGKLVVELAERDTVDLDDSAYTSELCVVDFDKGGMELPSALERSRWDQ